VGEDDGPFAPHHLVEGDQLLGTDERARAVMDEDMAYVAGKGLQGRHYGVLALPAAADEERRGRGEG
jgi:hypothetical protein